MQRAARFNVATAAALAAAVIAVTPVTPARTNALHGVQAPAIRLTANDGIPDLLSLLNDSVTYGPIIVSGDPLQTVDNAELAFNSVLTTGEPATNAALVSGG